MRTKHSLDCVVLGLQGDLFLTAVSMNSKGTFTPNVSVNVVIMLAILFSLKTMKLLENGLQPHSGVTPLFSMRIVSLASSQSCCNVDADAQCEQALNLL